MFTKFRNHLPELSVILAVLPFILLSPIFLVYLAYREVFPSKESLKFEAEYLEWLRQHEGEVFFCYTNRKKPIGLIEKYVLPELDAAINVVMLEGKVPQTTLNQRFVSHSLNNVKNVGFPNVMQVIDGKMCDYSLHKPIYNAINQSKFSELPSIVNAGISVLDNSGE